ncbi:hypothetical protein [Streptomyces sp. NPDC058280]|uniref:hypothetical protein n=1 Tax=Streptomyces sp. NPDC058280 TaxID=3346419 RepID=UPI0036EC366F
MAKAGLNVMQLATLTKRVDPAGVGLSKSLIGFIAGKGKTAREECSDRAAELVAAALEEEVSHLFEPVVFTVVESTSTSGSRTKEVRPLPPKLMDQLELAQFLQKSMSWIDKEIQRHAELGAVWPGLHYVGRSRRFDPYEVLAGQRRQHISA